MKEDLIQFIWRSKALLSSQLFTSSGMPIEVLHPGLLNTNQGPDFLFAKISIDGILWAGHIEVHVKASDWNLHNHQNDPNYQNIILHVVWENDQDIFWNNRSLPCLELQQIVDRKWLQNYQNLLNNNLPLPCSPFIEKIPMQIKTMQLERMMIDRLEGKTEKIKSELSGGGWDWAALLYQKVAHYIVAPINSNAMTQLCVKAPWHQLMKVFHDQTSLEALLFGTAGFLNSEFPDPYYLSLKNEFNHLKLKFELEEMEFFEWKFLRLRPSHFPCLRIAQMAALFFKEHSLFSKIIESKSIQEIYNIFDVLPHDYWNTHYLFGKKISYSKKAAIGQSTKDILIINVVCPILFAYGSLQYKDDLCDKALLFMQKLKVESNHITRIWKSYNFALDHAGHSQGGIQLFHRYCNEKKCTSCLIGNEILHHPI